MKQISIVTQNKPGILADVATVLGEKGVNIDSIDAEAVGEMGLVRMTVSDYDLALKVLRDAGLNALSEEVFLVRLADKPGALAGIARRFKEKEIDIRSLRIVDRDGQNAIAAVSCERPDEAKEMLKDVLVS